MQEFARYTAYYGSFNYSYILQWELINQDYQANTSTIRLRALIEVNANDIRWSRGSAVLDGDNFGLANIYDRGITEVYSKVKTIWHDSQGNANPYVDGSISTTFVMNGYCGGNIPLPHIPRGANIIKHEVSDISGTSFKVSWATDKPRYWTQYSLNGSAWTDAGDTVASDQKSGYYYIKNLNPSTKYTIKTRVRATDSDVWTESETIEVTTLGALIHYGDKRALIYYGKNGKWNLALPYYGKNEKWRIGK